MKTHPSFWGQILDRISEFFSGSPSHHYALRRKVLKLVKESSNSEDTFICASLGYYWPHGGKDEILIRCDSNGGSIKRIRTPMGKDALEKEV